MTIPVFTLLNSTSPQITALGSNPFRCFPAGMVPQDADLPAVTYSLVSGAPENYIAEAAGIDHMIVQLDFWAYSLSQAQSVADQCRAVLEANGRNCLVRFNPDDFEPDTKRFRVSYDFSFWLSR